MNERIVVEVPLDLPNLKPIAPDLYRLPGGGVGTLADLLTVSQGTMVDAIRKTGYTFAELAKAMGKAGQQVAEFSRQLNMLDDALKHRAKTRADAEEKAKRLGNMFGDCTRCNGKGVIRQDSKTVIGGRILAPCPNCTKDNYLGRKR